MRWEELSDFFDMVSELGQKAQATKAAHETGRRVLDTRSKMLLLVDKILRDCLNVLLAVQDHLAFHCCLGRRCHLSRLTETGVLLG